MKLKVNFLMAIAVALTSVPAIGQDKIVLPAAADPGLEAQVTEKDRGFVEDVLEDNMKEIAWSKAGVEKGTSDALKTHASHMLREHQKIDKAFRNYATKKNLVLTDIDGTGDINFLDVKRRKGPSWDREWASEMVSSHRNMIQMFEDAQATVTDPELKALIDKTLNGLRSHLEMSIKLKAELG